MNKPKLSADSERIVIRALGAARTFGDNGGSSATQALEAGKDLRDRMAYLESENEMLSQRVAELEAEIKSSRVVIGDGLIAESVRMDMPRYTPRAGG